MSATELHRCLVCGYEEMADAPQEGAICPSCGTQFDSEGFDRPYPQLRSEWIDRYMPWFSRGKVPPKNWSPYRQLIDAGFGADLVQHPRMRTDEDYRYAVDEAFADVRITKQLKALRESREPPLTQKALAELADMKQSRISELEGMNYSARTVTTLKRLARALGVRFRFSFDSWAELPREIENLTHGSLAVPSFDPDLSFASSAQQAWVASDYAAYAWPLAIRKPDKPAVGKGGRKVRVTHRPKSPELPEGNESLQQHHQINDLAKLPYLSAGA